MFTKDVFEQKFNYINENLVAANLIKNAIGYRYSSASFHVTRIGEFDLLSNYEG